MQKSVDYSIRAENNLKKIKAYIEQDNPVAAEKVIAFIFKSADELAQFPELGKIGERAGTRELVITKYPYTIIYKLTSARVIVIAVLHQSQVIK